MENLENKKELGEVEEEKVAGGVIWPDYLYHPIKPDEPEEPQEGGAEGTW